MIETAIRKIEAQQPQGRTAVWMVGEQLKEICRREPNCAELISQDLDNESLSLKSAEKKIKAYADTHKTGGFACVTPAESDRILREFYGLPPMVQNESVTQRPPRLSQIPTIESAAPEILDLASFM